MSVLLYELPASESTRTEQALMDEWIAYSGGIPSSQLGNNTEISQSQQKSSLLFSESNASREYRAAAAIAQTFAFVLIARLQQWCRQLFWLTIVCVIGCCGDSITDRTRFKTLRRVQRSIRARSASRMKNIASIEMQLLRHLTEPKRAFSHRRRAASRAPSPQLYDISEEAEIDF